LNSTRIWDGRKSVIPSIPFVVSASSCSRRDA
jgi:hypothetical protein